MKLCILGSEGQIGNYIKEKCSQKKIQYTAVDIDIDPKHDLRLRSDAWCDLIAASDVVIFLAFDVGGANYLREFQNSFDFINNNIKILTNVFESVRAEGKSIIFASSVTAFDINNSYGNTKLIGENYCRALDGINIRLWNIYGFETNVNKYHVIMDFIAQSYNFGQISCKTDGQERRQFLYGEDCASEIIDIAQSYNNTTKRDIHLSSGVWTSIREVAYIVTELTGAKPPKFATIKETMQAVEYSPVDNVFGKNPPEHSLREGIEKLVKRYYDTRK